MVKEFVPKAKLQLSELARLVEQPDFLAGCEAAYAARVGEAAQAVLASGQHIVMLTGPSASGKTTTANKLAQALTARGLPASVISLDNFFQTLDRYPRCADGTPDYESLYALDVPLVQKCLGELARGGVSLMPRFDFLTHTPQYEALRVEAGEKRAVIIEGIHALNGTLSENLPEDALFKVYAGLRTEYYSDDRRVIATRDLRIARRMVRDLPQRGHSPEFTLSQWDAIQRGEEQWIKPFKKDARLLIDTSFAYEPCLLAPLIAQLCAQPEAGGAQRPALLALSQRFAGLPAVPEKAVPQSSMLREFIGGLVL